VSGAMAQLTPDRRATDLPQRIVSGIVMAVPVLGAMYVGSPYFDVLVAVAGIVMVFEWNRMALGPHILAVDVVAAGAVVAAVAALAVGHGVVGFVVLAAGVLGSLVLARGRPWSALGVLYVGLPCLAFVWLRADEVVGRSTVFWLLALVWASDIGAYAFGRAIGSIRLAPALSPNKTWAGLLGGVGCGALVGAAAAVALGKESAWPLMLASGGLAAVAQAGDLIESAAKRYFGVKDTGTLIPGHGGLLDRSDALLVAVSVAALIAIVHQGSMLIWL